MKKYTEKQIESFKEMINNGIISQIDGDPELCRKIAKDIHEIKEGYFTFENLSTNEVINEWEQRGESWELLRRVIENQEEFGKERLMKMLLKDYEEYFPLMEINRKSMIKLLRLPFFATKEDIIKELNEIL
jgi:hypothetical protein